MSRFFLFVSISIFSFAAIGCGAPNRIEVDLSAPTPRFVLTGRTWGWPFVWPRINAFAIGSDTEPVWELEALEKRGTPVRNLAIVYGEVPSGFSQTNPAGEGRPGRLIPGKTYFVGATGPNDEVFRTVFALPVDPLGAPPNPSFTPDRKKMSPTGDAGRSTKPAG